MNNSLVRQVETADGEPRFGMLETIRAYALERLTESGEMECFTLGHAQYFGEIVINQVGQELYSANAPYWLGWLERELDNIRRHVRWSSPTLHWLSLPRGWLCRWSGFGIGAAISTKVVCGRGGCYQHPN